jgi:uncharacterized protein YegL
MSNELKPGKSLGKPSVLKSVTPSVPRVIPVIVLADISSSMTPEGNPKREDNIGHLNRSIRTMIAECQSPQTKGTISIAVITFGNGEGLLHMPLTPAKDAAWQDVMAYGNTPLGAAISVAAKMMGDKNVIATRDYRPILVLASDGQPNDDWQGPLEALNNAGRAAEADRFAIAIGSLVDRSVLERFIAPAGNYAPAASGIFEAGNEAQMHAAFQFVSHISNRRSVNRNPDEKGELNRTNPDLKGEIF